MKVKVIKRFRDKYTSEIHDTGDTLNISEKRANEILSVGKFIEIIEPAKEPAKKAKKKTTE